MYFIRKKMEIMSQNTFLCIPSIIIDKAEKLFALHVYV